MEQTLQSTDAVKHTLNGQRISGNVVKITIFTLMSGELFQTRQLLSRTFRHLSDACLTFLVGIGATVRAYIVAVLMQHATT